VYKRTDLNFRGVVEEITRAYSYLENFLEKYKWMAGGSITLADVTLLPNLLNYITVLEKIFKSYYLYFKNDFINSWFI
jgi:glutathione S-transferase